MPAANLSAPFGSWTQTKRHHGLSLRILRRHHDLNEHDCVVLTSDLPSEGLLSGDVGTVVHIHGNVSAYEVEFAMLAGKTIAVATVLPSQCRPIGHGDINHVPLRQR